MTKLLRAITPFALVLSLSLVLAPACGSKKDSKKAEACAADSETKESADACKKCCKGAGASGHSWMLGNGCKCL